MKEAKLRITEPEDAAGLLDIYKPYVLHTAITFEYEAPSLQEFEQRIRQFSAQYPYLVCEADGELLGYAYAHRFQERAAYGWNAECSVYVSQQAAGRHIGRALYSALIRLLRQQNVVNLYGVVTLPNSRSERLHEAMGFRRGCIAAPATSWAAGTTSPGMKKAWAAAAKRPRPSSASARFRKPR